jgi:sodium transport system ATP-binding protein
MIRVRHLGKAFQGIPAVRDLSFVAPDGAVTGLLGANGAGKTTTLRAIAGVLGPDRGSIHLDDVPVVDDPARARRLQGALLDHQGLYSRLTAREHLTYFGRLRGMAPAALSTRVGELLATLSMSRVADRRVGGFSEGERLKVALGCAMVHAPRHLLLDEPTNGLDVPTVRSLRAVLRDLRDAGTCILYSSHVLGEIEAVCDRVVIIAQGMGVAEGTLEDVKHRTGAASLEDAFVTLTQTEAVPW